MSERMAEHRANPACAGCRRLMDPIGFSLENYDAVGRWRGAEDGKAIHASGGLPDGSNFEGVTGLQQALLSRQELFCCYCHGKDADLRTGTRWPSRDGDPLG